MHPFDNWRRVTLKNKTEQKLLDKTFCSLCCRQGAIFIKSHSAWLAASFVWCAKLLCFSEGVICSHPAHNPTPFQRIIQGVKKLLLSLKAIFDVRQYEKLPFCQKWRYIFYKNNAPGSWSCKNKGPKRPRPGEASKNGLLQSKCIINEVSLVNRVQHIISLLQHSYANIW